MSAELQLIYAGLAVGVGAVLQAAGSFIARSRRRKRWEALTLSQFVQRGAKQYPGIFPADAMRVLLKIGNRRGSVNAHGVYVDWKGSVDFASPESVGITLETYSYVDGESSSCRVWLRWNLREAQQFMTEVSTEWASLQTVSNVEWTMFVEAIVDRIGEDADIELAQLFQEAKTFTSITNSPWEAGAPSLALGPSPTLASLTGPATAGPVAAPTASSPAGTPIASAQSSAPKSVGTFQSLAAKNQGSVSVPSRVYGKIHSSQATEILANFVSRGGILREPISGLLVLQWEGICVFDPNNNGLLETTICFSEYQKEKTKLVLTEELVINWEFENVPGAYGKPVMRVSCQWTGEFGQSSGDLIRFLMEKLDRDLLKAGAVPSIQATVQARGSGFVRTKPQSSVDWFRDLPENNQPAKPFWPSMQDYNEAIQYPETCFFDQELKNGEVEQTVLGLPKVATGAFASVYRMQCGDKFYAVRCFNNAMKDQEERYKRTSRFICADDLVYTVNLYYLEKGILVKGQWFPVLKMEWVQGVSIYEYIEKHHNDVAVLNRLRERFSVMMSELQNAGIAHSDLQHGNIIIRDDEYVLVDYDGMFVPELSGFFSNERGHPNYQHPEREGKHFGPYLDNFSAWVIDTALLSLIHDPSLWKRFAGDCESLLFKRSDFERPDKSELLHTLCHHRLDLLKERGNYLHSLIRARVERIPYLTDGYPALLSEQFKTTSEIPLPVVASKPAPGLPDWMQ